MYNIEILILILQGLRTLSNEHFHYSIFYHLENMDRGYNLFYTHLSGSFSSVETEIPVTKLTLDTAQIKQIQQTLLQCSS